MGNQNSTPEDDRAAMEQHVRRQRRFDLMSDGVLVPPLFGIPSDTRVNPSIILNTVGNTSLITPIGASPILLGFVDYLRTQSDLSYRLLHAHVQPGISITSFTSKNSLKVGIFDYSTANRMNSIPNIHFTPTLERSGTVSSDSSRDDDSTLRLPQSNSCNKSMFGGQLTFERQFMDPQGRSYGSIHCHTDPTNPLLPYTVQLIHRPIPSLSLFGVFTSSLSSPSPQSALSSQHTSPSSVLPSTNGYIGAQLTHTIPLSPNPSRNYQTSVQQYENTTDTAYDGTTVGTSYVAQTTYDDDTNLHCNLGIYVPIHWDNVIQTLDGVIPKSQKDPHLIPFYHDRNNSFINTSNSQNQQPQSFASKLLSSTNEVNGCASVSLLGATAAVQGSIPLSMTNGSDGTFVSGRINHNKYYCKTSSYFSTNINDEATNRSPIQLTIHQQNQFGPTTTSIISTISASQIITFQRYHFNIVDEYRVPYVHNTLAWTIQMESLSSSESTSSFAAFSSAEDSGEHNNKNDDGILKNRMNRVSLGLAWQLNRNVALKAVWYPQQSSSHFNENLQSPSSDGMTATTAILFKRWYYPRITCSILHKWSFYDPTKNKIVATSQFAGIGIDIETGDDYYSSASSNATNRSRFTDDNEDNNTGSSKQPPPTIAVLPKELYKLKQQQDRAARRSSGIPIRLNLNTSNCVHPAGRYGKPSVYA